MIGKSPLHNEIGSDLFVDAKYFKFRCISFVSFQKEWEAMLRKILVMQGSDNGFEKKIES